jgi:hypothetical protein
MILENTDSADRLLAPRRRVLGFLTTGFDPLSVIVKPRTFGLLAAKRFLLGDIWKMLGIGLLYCVVFEASLFGSGRMLEIGPLTVKMLLFSLILVYTFRSLISGERLGYSTVLLTSSFTALLLLGIVLGLLSDASLHSLGGDVSPLLAFFCLPFFEFTIRRKSQILKIFRIFVFAASIMGVGYAVLIGLLSSGLVSFTALYNSVSVLGDDFVFEGESGRLIDGAIFYKGAIFIGIALICVVSKGAMEQNNCGSFASKPLRHWQPRLILGACSVRISLCPNLTNVRS